MGVIASSQASWSAPLLASSSVSLSSRLLKPGRRLEPTLDESMSPSPIPSALAAASLRRSLSCSSSSRNLLALMALSLISITSVSTIGCDELMILAPLPVVCLPSPLIFSCSDRIGVLRAIDDIDDNASDAATSRLPRRRGGDVNCCAGGEGNVGEFGGEYIEGAGVADVDSDVWGRMCRAGSWAGAVGE